MGEPDNRSDLTLDQVRHQEPKPRTDRFENLLSQDVFKLQNHEKHGRIEELSRDALLMVKDRDGTAHQFFVKATMIPENRLISVEIVPTGGEVHAAAKRGDDQIAQVRATGTARDFTVESMRQALQQSFAQLQELGYTPDPEAELMLRTE